MYACTFLFKLEAEKWMSMKFQKKRRWRRKDCKLDDYANYFHFRGERNWDKKNKEERKEEQERQ